MGIKAKMGRLPLLIQIPTIENGDAFKRAFNIILQLQHIYLQKQAYNSEPQKENARKCNQENETKEKKGDFFPLLMHAGQHLTASRK